MLHISRLCYSLCVCCLLPGVTQAGAGNVTIQTDHPHYPGEGAFQTVEDCVRWATQEKKGEQERAIALYLWMLTHQWHLASPQEWLVPGEVPDTNREQQDLVVYDANCARFSYGYGLCGTVHAWNEPYWKALGMPVRRRAFPGHVNSEVFYKHGWRAFDTDMAGLVFRADGLVAGYQDIIADPSLVRQTKPPLPCYPFAWPSDFEGMKQGWQEIAKGGNWYSLYNGGYAAQPGIVHLRRGETFTRWFNPDHYGGPAKRRFWHHLPGGPFRNWTFANQGIPEHRGEQANCRGNASYCNGEFIYQPDLTTSDFREGIVPRRDNLGAGGASPRLYSRDGKPAEVTFQHFSPYVICGDPVDDANPMSGKATDGLVVSGQAVGEVTVEVSVDQRQSWNAADTVTGKFSLDLTEAVKGRYGWHLRFRWTGKAGLDELRFVTTTQVSQAIYPRLKSDGCNVTWRCSSQCVVPVAPNTGLPESALGGVEVRDLRSPNVIYQPRDGKNRLAWKTSDNKPGQVVFRVASAQGGGAVNMLSGYLQQLSAAVRYAVRVPPAERPDFRLEISTNEGKSWQLLTRAEIPRDNEFSSGWMYGQADIAVAKTRQALIRATFYQDGYTAGLIGVRLYGIEAVSSPTETFLTYGWKEGSEQKSHTARIPAGTQEQRLQIPTGSQIADDYIRLEVP